jgi:hypothetical protein
MPHSRQGVRKHLPNDRSIALPGKTVGSSTNCQMTRRHQVRPPLTSRPPPSMSCGSAPSVVETRSATTSQPAITIVTRPQMASPATRSRPQHDRVAIRCRIQPISVEIIGGSVRLGHSGSC